MGGKADDVDGVGRRVAEEDAETMGPRGERDGEARMELGQRSRGSA